MAHDIKTDRNDPLKELEAALSVGPSPEFAARVRERVRQEPARTSWGWWSLAAASVALVIVGYALRNGGPGLQTRPTETPAPIVAAGSEDPALHSVPLHSVPPVADAMEGRVFKPARVATTTRPVAVPVVAHSHEPEVLVSPDEGIAIRRLLLAIKEGRANVPAPGLRVMEDADGHLLEPTPIDIPLIKIEPLPGTPVIDSGGKVK